MRKFLSERNLVIVLFIAAFIVFSFAQQATMKQEKLQSSGAGSTSSNIDPKVNQAADNIIKPKEVSTTQVKQ